MAWFASHATNVGVLSRNALSTFEANREKPDPRSCRRWQAAHAQPIKWTKMIWEAGDLGPTPRNHTRRSCSKSSWTLSPRLACNWIEVL